MIICVFNHSNSFAESNGCQFKGLSNCAACEPLDDGFCGEDDFDNSDSYGSVAGGGDTYDDEFGSSYYQYDEPGDGEGSISFIGGGRMTANIRVLNAPLSMSCVIQSV